MARVLLRRFRTITITMIEALFSQNNYLAAKKGLDASGLKHRAIASNLANVETPGYKRVDTSPSFKAAFNRALRDGNKQQLANLQATVTVDQTAISKNKDGNTVDIEQELVALNQNALAHKLQTQLVSGTLAKLRLAITGRPR